MSSKGSLAAIPTVTHHDYLRGPVPLTLFAERLARELLLTVFTIEVCRCWVSNTKPSVCGANALTHYVTAAVVHTGKFNITKYQCPYSEM